MKYLKMYERFDAIDPFGEEVYYNNNNLKMKIVKFIRSNNHFIIQDIKNVIHFFKNKYDYHSDDLSYFELNPILDDDCKIYIYDRDNIYPIEGTIIDMKVDKGWKCYSYKNLPQEIKDQIIV